MKRIHAALLGAAGLAMTAGAAQIALAPPAAAAEIAKEIAIGQAVNPVTLSIPGGVDPNSVYLGSYLVNVVADCNGCHSNNEYAAGGNPFLGQPKVVNTARFLNGGQAFGPFVSRNITPVSGTSKPAGLTAAQFRHVLLTGEDPQDRGTLLQVMPWDAFQNMSLLEIQAIYNYLSSIPSLPMGGTGACAAPAP